MYETAQARLKRLKQNLSAQNLCNIAYPVFIRNTPIRTGYARAHTQKSSTEISARYPYAQRLDQGWSRQSPNGMVKPTLEFVNKYIQRELRK